MAKISVKVIPNAKKNEVLEDITDMFNMRCLKIKVTSPPEDGKANIAVIEILSNYLGIKKSNITILKGLTSRNKIIDIAN